MIRFLSAWGHTVGASPASCTNVCLARYANFDTLGVKHSLQHAGNRWHLGTILPVPVMTTTEAVVPARRLTLSGTFSTKAPLGQAGPDSPTHEGQHDHADRVKCDGQYDE